MVYALEVSLEGFCRSLSSSSSSSSFVSFLFSGVVEDVRMLRVVYSFRGDVNENSLSLDSVKELILVLLVFFSKNRLVRC